MNEGVIELALASGVLTGGYLVIALFLLKFWRQTKDRLFAIFAFSFGLLAIQRLLVPITLNLSETATWAFVIRLLAFVLILVAILDKNRSSARK